ncbi:MAG TPA: hypothetical protein VEC56_11915 [Candidatus Krumholzibacteria bacterium]|nr:hypothetical protein [Candidatus Krumholzibacteria bacterium]
MKLYRVFLLAVAATASITGCNEDRSPSTPTSADPPNTLEEAGGGSMPFSEAQIFIEYNATANDAGIQVFLDAEPWKEIQIVDHRGRELLEIEASGGMKRLGLTELRFEGAEPEPDEVLDAFPAGEYRFRGRAVERFRLTGTATLSHDIPPAPEFSPSQGEVVDPDNVVIEWDAIGGVDRYQVIVESDANGFVLEVSVSSSTTSLHVPPTFLEPNTEYKAEILAIAPSGNRTITEGTFVTGP